MRSFSTVLLVRIVWELAMSRRSMLRLGPGWNRMDVRFVLLIGLISRGQVVRRLGAVRFETARRRRGAV
jgi:hypothetical protein